MRIYTFDLTNKYIYYLIKVYKKAGWRSMLDYKNIISHIDIDRSFGAMEYSIFSVSTQQNISEFSSDIEDGNDSIELHLIKSMAYKEILVIKLKKANGAYSDVWRDFLKEEQKTFGGSKIFYMNNDCTKLLVFSLPNEMRNKINMVITRLNKINERITRINSKIKRENIDLYASRIRDRQTEDKRKEEIINFINQNLRV